MPIPVNNRYEINQIEPVIGPVIGLVWSVYINRSVKPSPSIFSFLSDQLRRPPPSATSGHLLRRLCPDSDHRRCNPEDPDPPSRFPSFSTIEDELRRLLLLLQDKQQPRQKLLFAASTYLRRRPASLPRISGVTFLPRFTLRFTIIASPTISSHDHHHPSVIVFFSGRVSLSPPSTSIEKLHRLSPPISFFSSPLASRRPLLHLLQARRPISNHDHTGIAASSSHRESSSPPSPPSIQAAGNPEQSPESPSEKIGSHDPVHRSKPARDPRVSLSNPALPRGRPNQIGFGSI